MKLHSVASRRMGRCRIVWRERVRSHPLCGSVGKRRIVSVRRTSGTLHQVDKRGSRACSFASAIVVASSGSPVFSSGVKEITNLLFG
jgi:hypothetical protein